MNDTVIDVVGAKKYLLENPAANDAFDRQYGGGAAYAVVNDEYITPEDTAARAAEIEAQGQNGFFSAIKEIGVGVADGLETAINETGQTINSVSQYLEEKTGTGRLVWEDKDGDGKVDIIPSYWDREKVVENADQLGEELLTRGMQELDVVREPEGMLGGFAKGASQFLTGFALLGGGKGGLVRAFATGGVVDATMFDPYEANISSIISEAEWSGPHIEQALASLKTNPDAPEWENRLRNAIEGGITGLAAEGIIKGVKHLALTRKARQEITSIGKVTDDTQAELEAATLEIDEIAKSVDETNPNKGLQARPDGTFVSPEGSIYKPDGDKLEFVGKEPKPVTAPRETPDAPDAPKSDNSPDVDTVRTDVEADVTGPEVMSAPKVDSEVQLANRRADGAALGAQTAPKKISTLAKVPVVNKDVLDQVLRNMKEMNHSDIKAIEDGGAFNIDTQDGLMTGDKLISVIHDTLKDEGVAKALKFDNPVSLQKTTEDALKYISRTTNTDVNVLIRDLNATETMTRGLAQKIVAGKMAMQTTARKITDLSNKLDDAVTAGKDSASMERELYETMQLHMEVQANTKSMQTSAARATSAGRIRTDADLSMDTLDGLSAFGGSQKIRDLAKKLRYVKDGESAGRIVSKAMDRKWIGVLNEYWINTILSGYKTQILNVTANTANLFLLPAERAMGGLVQGARTGDFTQARQAAKQYKFLYNSMAEALHMSAIAFKDEQTILDSSVKFDVGAGTQNKQITAENLGVKGQLTGNAVDIVGKAARLPSRFLMSADEFFKQTAFRSRIKAMIEVDLEDMSLEDVQAKGYATKDDMFQAEIEKAFTQKTDAAERFQDLVLMGRVIDDPEVKEEFINNAVNSFNEASPYAVEALREARATTFTTPLQAGTASFKIQELANQHPLIRQVIPFIQTPINIMGTAWDRTPGLNMLHKSYKQALNSPDQAVRAEAIGKMATGTIVVGTLIPLALNGRVTGGGPTDPAEAAMWRKSKDWQPYSVNFGSHENPNWVSFAKLDPHTTLFGIIGDITEMYAKSGDADQDFGAYISMTIASVGNNVVNKTYLKGISDIVTLLNSKDDPAAVERFLNQRTASFMPYSSMNTQLAQTFEDNLLEARGFMDTVRSKSYFMRSQLPVKYDWLSGEAETGPESLKMLPHITKKSLKPEHKQLASVQAELRKLGYGAQGPDRTISGVTLTGEQYHRWNELMGTEKLGGKTLVERLDKMIGSKRYQEWSKFDGQFTTQEDPRVDALRVIISDYKTRAKKKLLREVPELNQSVRDYTRYQRGMASGNHREKPEIDMNNIFK